MKNLLTPILLALALTSSTGAAFAGDEGPFGIHYPDEQMVKEAASQSFLGAAETPKAEAENGIDAFYGINNPENDVNSTLGNG